MEHKGGEMNEINQELMEEIADRICKSPFVYGDRDNRGLAGQLITSIITAVRDGKQKLPEEVGRGRIRGCWDMFANDPAINGSFDDDNIGRKVSQSDEEMAFIALRPKETNDRESIEEAR